ncbi:Bacterial extracellular solute-binding protein [Meiothermus luteus]|uniref:Bacterial extracellular solute-binding protein n=1 Tax=Meiothermus luteus TaxID=2026184 RepID=A0A399EHJ1_9DEIN|nr:extracellular solute-binding protein [Meiothermus luteus]RIH84077.1 Bacterial extracellular solute-binding protein [Meiothermus luteus]RMH55569.1 MAG: extracellular solute-binding protein [Deinococcota bacterium]
MINKSLRWWTFLVLLLSFALAQQGRFQGVSINVLTFTGPQIAEPLRRHAAAFERATGARVNVTVVPFSDLYQQILTDATTGTNSYDAWIFAPQWMADFAPAGIMEDLTARVRADTAIQWNDIAPFFREFSATYGGKILTIPLDGDFQMVYYRTDVLRQLGLQPPRTWDDYLNIAQRAHGRDMNGDGRPDFGSCIAKKRNAQSYWMFMSILGGYVQSQGTRQGAFFDTRNMQPLVKNQAFAEALRVYKETTRFGPPDELNLDVGDTRGLFTSGRCALSIDWGDIGPLSIDPQTSKVKDLVGAVILPGSRRVLDRNTGNLVNCTPQLCPHAINGVNHAPYAAFGGWSGGINAKVSAPKKDVAYALFSYMSQPAQANKDVTIGITGFNPYRISQFRDIQNWVAAGFSEAGARNYLGAIQQSLNSPNMVLDLRIPKAQQYQQVVLDRVLSEYLAGQLTIAQAQEQIHNGWEEITNAEGRQKQLQAYLASLGIGAR